MGNIPGTPFFCGVEKWHLVWLITKRSQVQILSPLFFSAYRITVITPPLQGGDAGAIPTTRSDRLVIPRSRRLQAFYHHIGWSLLEDTVRRFSGWRNRYRFSVLLIVLEGNNQKRHMQNFISTYSDKCRDVHGSALGQTGA